MRTFLKSCLFISCFVIPSYILDAKECEVPSEDTNECQSTATMETLPSDVISFSRCNSWITVARCVKVRKCWVGITSNGTKYGTYWQNKFDCSY